MGSSGRSEDLPLASAPFLVLAHPTNSELRRIWTMTHGPWGPALSLEDYIEREAYLYTIPGSKDGLQTSWILTDGRLPPDERPILSSCDTYRKPAAVSYPPPPAPVTATAAADVVAHGIGAVFTDPEFRGQGYASRMMREVGEALRTWQAADEKTHALFSVLYSDIGKKFYSKLGWLPAESTHVTWMPAPEAAASATEDSAVVRPLGRAELAELCAVDENLLRAHHLPRIAAKTGNPAVALVPTHDSIVWHLDREDFMCSRIFPDGRTPTVRGAVYTCPTSGLRLWTVWARSYYGGLQKAEGNTLYLLRVVVENKDADGMADAETESLVRGFRGVLQMAQREAALWRVCNVQLWNPRGMVRRLVEKCGIPCEWVAREEDSIASLRWYGEGGDGRKVEWVANDKFGWC
ncbi:hypothetical protein MAPG_11437 [Magnaporthiopsis poae ATCC 64411]|uniref:Uncharacterized protein n=1 Tax=Magnaporthiopsis poae (strain ATCC 64411 / 73-15) TaxID=644358 RepID=A0A0C4EF98_MAGP6|nr:hypothetical protein MAPG_11437 [Magnaporthiopsis poae ATCC 64411]